MVGTWKINLLFALVGFFITFSFSLLQNGLWTTMIRSLIVFFFFFLIAYLFRWMFSFIQKDHQPKDNQQKNNQRAMIQIEKRDDLAKIEHLFEELSEEEQQKVVEYVRNMLNNERE
jgi:Na+-transporting methylmalonyl-CoA/oxaloacetate decarboxylase gamma subunit